MDYKSISDYYGEKVAEAGLELGAIKLSIENPFTWASGYRMPIYNDNRLFLSRPEYRALLSEAFSEMADIVGLEKIDNIAGTSTAGIPHATTLADRVKKPLSYVRASNKDHGLKNKIEGIGKDGYKGKYVLLIEDLISTGGSSIAAVEAIREAGGKIDECFAIFSYGFDRAEEAFSSLSPVCHYHPILTFPTLLDVATKKLYINESDRESLIEWMSDPFSWGEKRGFKKEER